ncbi:MAG: hypothetical protein R2692_00975 [Microbacterium sp.]
MPITGRLALYDDDEGVRSTSAALAATRGVRSARWWRRGRSYDAVIVSGSRMNVLVRAPAPLGSGTILVADYLRWDVSGWSTRAP